MTQYNVLYNNVKLLGPVADQAALSSTYPAGLNAGACALVGTSTYTIYQCNGTTWSVMGGGISSVASTDITDSTTTGRALITAADTGAARTAIGATTTGSALIVAADAAAGRTVLGLGTAATQASTAFAAASHTHTVSQLSDATAFGRSLIQAADAAEARLDIGATTTGSALIVAADAAAGRTALGLGTAATQASTAFAAASHTHTASQISDSTTVGRSLMTAADTGAARTAIGATTTGSALIVAADAAAGRTAIGAQATLVNGTNIKSVNSMSLVGSGNLTVSTGGAYSISSSVFTLALASIGLVGAPHTLTVVPGTGCTIRVETSTNGSTYTVLGDFTEPAAFMYTQDLNETSHTHIRVTRTAGSVSSLFTIG